MDKHVSHSDFSRLLLGALLMSQVACSGSDKGAEAEVPGRVAAVTVQAESADDAAKKWCDVSYAAAEAPTLDLPGMEPARPNSGVVTVQENQWTWINLWATWCGPCKKEMPLIARWDKQLQGDGAKFTLWYLSVDEDKEALSSYLSSHGDDVNEHVARMTSLPELETWLGKYKVEGSPSIPIQVLAGPGGKVRCIKLGSVRESDYHTLKTILKAG